jgi:succinate dehydrogenase/fumarate reductase flavoprotein subunit
MRKFEKCKAEKSVSPTKEEKMKKHVQADKTVEAGKTDQTVEADKTNKSDQVSRRDFLKGAGIATLGATALGLTACAGAPAGATQAPAATTEKWDYVADVVVVGFGGSGAVTAISAADAGASVIVLEKNAEKTHLCNTLMAGGIFHSPNKDGDPQALRQYLRAMFSGDNLPTKTEPEQSPLFVDEIVEKFAELEPENVDFMKSLDPEYNVTESNGASFPDFPGAEECGYVAYYSGYGNHFTPPEYPTIDLPKQETGAGLAFYNCLRNGVSDRSDKIEVKWETPGQHLIKNAAGEIIGVIAEQAGAEVKIKAKRAVVLTAGGYEYNEEMRRAFLEGPGITGWAFYGTTSNEGDGIRMGIEQGAQLAKVGKAASRLIWSCPDVIHNNMQVGSICDVAGSAGTIVVNSKGERFMNETLITRDPSRYFSYKNAVHMDIETLTFPNDPAYMIIDENMRKAGPLVSLNLSTCGYGLIPWDPENQGPIDKGWLIKGDSIEELANNIKAKHENNKGQMDATVLSETMKKYQTMVDTKVDVEFGRTGLARDAKTGQVVDKGFQPIDTPPFYALPLVAGGPNTKGGIQADGNRHVIDWFNKPIPRLYTAGEMSSVLKFVYQGGGNLTECIVCGRIAGKNAAEETPWE